MAKRSVAVVIDPIQSVKGKVVIDAFRTINPQLHVLKQEPRQTTSNVGHLNRPSIQALIHGLDRAYYSLNINYRKNELEQTMLLNLHKAKWTEGLHVTKFDQHSAQNLKDIEQMKSLTVAYNKAIEDEEKLTKEKLIVHKVGKLDAKRHLEDQVKVLMTNNVAQSLGTMLDTMIF